MDSTRDRLIDAATRLLDQGGPAAVTLREVGRLAGVSHNAPYKHFAGKEDLLAAVAARELAGHGRGEPAATPGDGDGSSSGSGDPPPDEALHALLHRYVRWALRHPARFKLTFGSWSTGSAELTEAATEARAALVAAVARVQAARALPAGDSERLAALILATAHGAVDLALSGHLARDGKGGADPDDLVADLLGHLRPA